MICPIERDETDLLLDDAAGTLARRGLHAEVAAELAEHMKTCPACTAFRRDQKAVWDALDLWEAPPVSADFNRRLWQRIDAAAAVPWYRNVAESLRIANWKPMIPLTAALLLVVGGFLLDHPRAKTTAAPDSVSIVEADQVEQTLDDIQLLRQLDMAPAAGNSKTAM